MPLWPHDVPQHCATCRVMQAVDNREARLRSAFQCIETQDGRLRREDIVRLLTVQLYSLW